MNNNKSSGLKYESASSTGLLFSLAGVSSQILYFSGRTINDPMIPAISGIVALAGMGIYYCSEKKLKSQNKTGLENELCSGNSQQ